MSQQLPPTRRTRHHHQKESFVSSLKEKFNQTAHFSLKKKIMTAILGVLGCLIGFLLILCLFWIFTSPSLTEADLQGSTASIVFDSKGKEVYTTNHADRILVGEDEISNQIFDAVTSIEDRRFLKHHGIDPIRIGSSFLANLRAGGISQGGSTLTQQLVKLSVFSTKNADRTYKRKVQEMWLSLQLEGDYTKKEIFEYYINKVYMANSIYGIGTASKIYYGKPLKDLSLDQTALLAGMPQAPNDYDPYTHPEQAKNRRDTVLYAMLDNKKISKSDYEKAIQEPINHGLLPLAKEDKGDTQQKLMLDAYMQQVAQDVKDAGYDLYSDGLKVYTHLDMDAQQYLHKTAEDPSHTLFSNDKIQTAVTVLDTSNSHILAMFGGRHLDSQLGYNRATQLNRSVGSSIKPLADYAPAFEYLDYSPGQTEDDKPFKYSDGSEVFNWDRQYKGTITLRDALKNSRNIPAIKVFKAVSAAKSDEFLKKLGIILNDGKGVYESNAIGGEITPLQLNAAYASFGNSGRYTQPKAVNYFTTINGDKITIKGKSTQAMRESTAYMITSILKDTFKSGLSSWIHNGSLNEAGKTGTTNYSEQQMRQLRIPSGAVPDHWASGYTKNHSVVVWTGHDEPFQPNGYLNQSQQQIADNLYRRIMDYMEKRKPSTDWEMPSTVHKVPLVFNSHPLRAATTSTPSSSRITDLINENLYKKIVEGKSDLADINDSGFSYSEDTSFNNKEHRGSVDDIEKGDSEKSQGPSSKPKRRNPQENASDNDPTSPSPGTSGGRTPSRTAPPSPSPGTTGGGQATAQPAA